ncbi:MAG TPA: hypothetical protein PLG94_12235 [Smithellaceae bacterium]|nr:hypothetical protein [Smithellaceae bacterium]
MKEKEPFATEQSDQPAESGQQMPASKNGVFLMRGQGQSIEEFARKCVQSMKDAGPIKGKLRPKKTGTGSPTNWQNLPDEKDQQ